MLSLGHLTPALRALRFSQEAKKENIHQRKILETGCVPSVRSISFYCHLNKKTWEGNLGFQHWRAGDARQGSSHWAVGQGAVRSGVAGVPKEPQSGEIELRTQGHCRCPSCSQYGTKRGLALEAALQEQPQQALGRAVLPPPPWL